MGDYMWGNYQGNSSKEPRQIFQEVTYPLADLIDTMELGVLYDLEGQTVLRLKAEEIVARQIYHNYFGKCFEIHLAQFARPLKYARFNVKLSTNVYINPVGHFHNRDSFSKVEVNLKESLYIDVSYEIIIQNEEKHCRKYIEETYDSCTERALEAELINLYNCSVPFLYSKVASTPICHGRDLPSKARMEKNGNHSITKTSFQAVKKFADRRGMQDNKCPEPCQKMVVYFGFPFIDR